jgi:peptidyl-prolyl cis-trans isomerase SurA
MEQEDRKIGRSLVNRSFRSSDLPVHTLRRCVFAGVAALALAFAGTARASIVERVVAVVGERPILLSDLRHRARPFLYRIIQASPDPAQQAAHETEMFKELLSRMIDDRLEEHAADQAHLSVTPDEVDNALRNVAGQAKITVRDLMAEAKRQGLSEQDYRDEIRRQVLEGKLIQLRVRGRVRVTDQDARASYDHWVKDFETQQPVDVRIIAMRLPKGATEALVTARLKLADQIVERARNGEDYCKLVREYSDEQRSAETCGSPGPQPIDSLQPPIQEAVHRLKEGETSDPIRFGNEAVIIVQLGIQPKIPPFEQVKEQMADRAFGEAMERQRKLWLQELRRGVYVDVRL